MADHADMNKEKGLFHTITKAFGSTAKLRRIFVTPKIFFDYLPSFLLFRGIEFEVERLKG
jgi:deoxyinosine 3'endonuclease (endonuclease V)